MATTTTDTLHLHAPVEWMTDRMLIDYATGSEVDGLG